MNMFFMFLLGLLPVIWLVIALTGLKWEAHIASLGALVVAFVEAIFIWKMSLLNASTAALEGFAMAIWPIVLVIIAAIFTYNVTVYTGAMDVIKRMITSISNDRRILVILIGWCFGGFMEGMAGYGTAIAIPASMLYALGFEPVEAILVCLIANSCPTMFGAIGIPTSSLASLTSLDPVSLSFAQVLQVAPILFVCPFLMVMLTSKGKKGLKGIVPLLLVAALSFIIPEFIVAKFLGADLPIVVAGVCSLICTFAYTMHYSETHETPAQYAMDIKHESSEPIDVKKALVSWSPFILIFFVLLGTSKLVPFIHEPLAAIKSSIQIYAGGDTPYTFSWIATPGILVMISGLIGAFIQKCTLKDIFTVLGQTIKQMSKTIVTMLGVLGCAKIMGYSGMITSIATFFVTALGTFYPLVAPLIGALGTFVTGSGTSSGVLFGNVQVQAAKAIGSDPYWLVAANSLGTSAGKMMSPQSIAIGCAACGLTGKDGEILGKIFKYTVAFIIVMAIITFAGGGLWELMK